MKIETKFDIDDIVYFIGKYEICKDRISHIEINRGEPVAYRMRKSFNSITERELYSSLEYLLHDVKTKLEGE